MTGFYEKGGKTWIDKDPDDKLFYGIDLADELTMSGTTITGVEAIVVGLTVEVPAYIDGTKGVVMLSGLDVSAAPVNYCTLRFTLSSTEQMDQTIYFKRKDK